MAKSAPTPSDPGRRQAAQQCFIRAQEVIKKGDYKYAITLLKDACKLAPEQLVYRQMLRMAAKKKFDNNKHGSRFAAVTTVTSRAGVKAAKAKKEYPRALECCEDCLSENPWDSGILLEVAMICEELGWLEMGIWSAESALERDVMDATVNRALAKLYERHGAFTKAMDCYERVKKACPADEEADRKMKDLAASATIDKGGYEGAQSFTRAVADKTKTQEMLDESKGGTGESRFAAQIADLEQKIKNKPTELGPYLQLSQVFRRIGKLDQASAIMEQAKSVSGGHPDAIMESNEIEIDRLRFDLSVAQKQCTENPANAEAQTRLKELDRTLNDYELREFQRRAERNPTDAGIRVDLGIRLAKANLLEQAIAELQKGRNSPARKPEAAKWLGWCFHTKKIFALAKKNYEESLPGLTATDQKAILELRYLLGRVCEDMNDKPTAIQNYMEIAGIDYAYRDVASRLDTLNSGGTVPPTAVPPPD